MARFDTTGLDDIISQMQQLKEDEGPVAEEMVNAAVEEIKFQWQLSAGMHGHVRTGAMIESIGIGPGPVRAGSLLYRDVYPHGSDAKGVRNAEKAFILNYGRSNMPGSYWVEEADENSGEPVQARCEEIWDRFLQEHG